MPTVVIIDHGKVSPPARRQVETQAGDDVLEVHLRDAESLSGVAAVLAAVGRDPGSTGHPPGVGRGRRRDAPAAGGRAGLDHGDVCRTSRCGASVIGLTLTGTSTAITGSIERPRGRLNERNRHDPARL